MLEIKKSHKDTVIAFNNSGVPLGKRSQADLLDLAILGLESGHRIILDAFVKLPSLESLKKKKLESIEAQVSATNTTTANTENATKEATEKGGAKQSSTQK